VKKIANLTPDLLLVGKSVSRQAQEFLQQHNIVLVMHVKPSLMERIARRTGAMIIASIDHVDKVGEEAIGHCANFSVKSFQSDYTIAQERLQNTGAESGPEDQKAAKENANAKAKSKVNLKGRVKIKRDEDYLEHQYMFLDGCPEVLGCTLFLRGGSNDQLVMALSHT
jgi:hypothetical protein